MQQWARPFSLIVGLALSASVVSDTTPGDPAPAFLVSDATGESHTLSQYIGEWLVLEWFDPGCEAVQQAYANDALPQLQERYREEGVKWLTIISSKPGPDNVVEPEEAMALKGENGLSSEAPILLDETSVMARAYSVEAAPYVILIDPKGTLMYRGAPGVAPAETEDRGNSYIEAALESAMAGEPLEQTATPANGCELDLEL
ncbi:redoxin domain-containing protein [Marinimicrobium locisalis]|uniref:redoxin domain-containing protein n=1 Tax=Marinimicrobium locisalis TaxID=546022 RepID=UPI003221E345